MKVHSLWLACLSAGVIFLAANFLGKVNSNARAESPGTQVNGPAVLPPFLEKGKTYSFSFGASLGGEYGINPVLIVGKIEKFEPNSGWVYINYLRYVNDPKKKEPGRKFEGYGWINVNQAFQCVETAVSP